MRLFCKDLLRNKSIVELRYTKATQLTSHVARSLKCSCMQTASQALAPLRLAGHEGLAATLAAAVNILAKGMMETINANCYISWVFPSGEHRH